MTSYALTFVIMLDCFFLLEIFEYFCTWANQTLGQKDVDPVWLGRARGSFNRAADGIGDAFANTDFTDPEACRILNDRIMRVRLIPPD